MASTVHAVDHQGNAPAPLIGAQLRRPFYAARVHILSELHAAGLTDLQGAHLAVFQYPGPDGRSPGEIARAIGATKQATNNLLTQLEQSGYLIREVNASNRRERIVTLTDQGHAAIRAIRAAVTRLEAAWRQQLGPKQYDQLRALLGQLNEIVAEQTAG